LKKIVFLIIVSLLVIGLVLPGCDGGNGGNGGPTPPVIYTFENDEVIIGIIGDHGHTTGDFNYYGYLLGAGQINAMGGINIGGVAHNYSFVKIDTDEATDETGITGAAALSAAISADNFDILMGSYRTEAVEYYREVAMTAKKVFFDFGAATEILCHSVLTNYNRYKYWFKGTPYNEHFLAMSVLRNINSVAVDLRVALNLSPGANLDAVIIAENLKWSKDEQEPKIKAGLAAMGITWKQSYFVSSLTSGDTLNALSDIVAKGYDPHIIIPVYSGYMGIAYDVGLQGYVAANLTCAMSVGINVMEQLKSPWGAGNLTNPPGLGGGPMSDHVILDTWADGLNQTAKTGAFWSAFLGMIGEYPLYTAATYDGLFVLKECLEDVATYNATTGVGELVADDLIDWYEDPTNAEPTTTGTACLYPPWDGLTKYFGTEALNITQKTAIYGAGWTYHTYDWLIPPHTPHDVVYGPGYATGVGAQWQWFGNATHGIWKKVGVWPRDLGVNLVDQYGDWNITYAGTYPIVIPQYVIDHH